MPIDAESFVILENVDSTNNYAMGKIHSGEAKDGNAWFAKEQTNGKGQWGKTWEAQKGQNIILSIVADTRFLQVYQQFQLSVVVSLSCYDFSISSICRCAVCFSARNSARSHYYSAAQRAGLIDVRWYIAEHVYLECRLCHVLVAGNIG